MFDLLVPILWVVLGSAVSTYGMRELTSAIRSRGSKTAEPLVEEIVEGKKKPARKPRRPRRRTNTPQPEEPQLASTSDEEELGEDLSLTAATDAADLARPPTPNGDTGSFINDGTPEVVSTEEEEDTATLSESDTTETDE